MFERQQARNHQRQPSNDAETIRAIGRRQLNVFEDLRFPERPKIDPPENPSLPCKEPTKSGTFKWLTAGLIAAGTTAIAAHASVLAIGYTLLANSGSKWCFGAAIAAAAVSTGVRLWAHMFGGNSKRSFDDLLSKETQRVQSATREAAEDRGIAVPKVRQSALTKNLGMLDRPGPANLLVFNPKATARLNDQELRGIAGHEIEHADRWYTAFSFTSAIVRGAATAALSWAAGHQTWVTMNGSGFLSNLVPFAAAAASFIAVSISTGALLSFIENIAVRANEIRTDIRAVERTQDLEQYRSALTKLYELLYEGRSKWVARTQPIATHPPLAKRMRWIEAACGR